jgi:hypothetical protein
MSFSENPVLAELIAREPIFHRPQFAATPADFARLMSSTYWEVGASGRIYTRDFILESLTAEPPVDAAAAGWHIIDPQCLTLSPDTHLVTYTLHQGQRRSRRATLWQSTPEGWQILYHQGTLMPPEEI